MAAPLFDDPIFLRAFPQSARADAEVTFRAFSQPLHPTPSALIQDTNQQLEGFYPAIYVHGEPLQVPYRHYYEWPSEERTKDLTATQRLILACWMSRSHDGRVRQLALSIMAWTQMIAFTGTKARRWEPKKLRARLFEIAGKAARHARQTTLHLAATAPDVKLLINGMKRIAALSPP